MKELKNPYFDIQAKAGITKHFGGWIATKELIDLCGINRYKYLLVVGSGNGVSACKIAKETNCKVMGIDISSEMVALSKKEAKRLGFERKVKFMIGDIDNLPFKKNIFDAVVSESVTAFAKRKDKTLKEYARVLKVGGYLGLNETTWVGKPTRKMRDFAWRSMGGCDPESYRDWRQMTRNAGLKEVVSEKRPFKFLEQLVGEFQVRGFGRSIVGGVKMLNLYLTKEEYRKAMQKMAKDSKNIPKGFMKCLGYGVYVGRKI